MCNKRTCFWHIAIVRYSLNAITMHAMYYSVACITQPRSIFDNYVEHGLEIGRRARDDAKNLTRRGLLLGSLGALPFARFKFIGEALQFFFELTEFGSARTLFLL